MRTILIAAFLAAAATSQATEFPMSTIDLDAPGAMDDVRRTNPDRYHRIAQIRDAATRIPCFTPTFRRTLQAKFDARDSACSFALMTSFPGKRHLTFTLDDARYVTVVTMSLDDYRAVPAMPNGRR